MDPAAHYIQSGRALLLANNVPEWVHRVGSYASRDILHALSQVRACSPRAREQRRDSGQRSIISLLSTMAIKVRATHVCASQLTSRLTPFRLSFIPSFVPTFHLVTTLFSVRKSHLTN